MVNLGGDIYCFGEFRLDPLTRELRRNGELIELAASAFDCLVYLVRHRERAVGKDELISAVWGRVDVSDNLLAQTIVRLRRALGEAGSEQRFIKTVPRVGYRWAQDTRVVSPAPPSVSDASRSEGRKEEAKIGGSPKKLRLRRSLVIAFACVVLLTLVYAGWRMRHATVAKASSNRGTAIVLPADVNAPEDWKWLRLGLMDLISGSLRETKVPVESSQTVLDLLGQGDAAGGAQFAPFALVIHPHVTLSDKVWHVHLDANRPTGEKWQAESSSDNVLQATRSATDLLLAQIGFAAKSARSTFGDAKEEYLLRINAAGYAGSIDVQRELIDKAPPDLRETPEFEYAKAVFYCNQGEYEACKQGLADLLQRLPADKQPILRGRTLAQQWYVYFRDHNYAGGEAALSEAVQLLQKRKNPEYLAFAYAQRAELEMVDGKFEQAESDFGLARVDYSLAGDTAGAFGIDDSLAALAMQRGQFVQAIPTIERAYEEYLRMGMRQFLESPLVDLVISQRLLLRYPDELATTDRYWPLEQKHFETTEKIARHVLVAERAHALADNGRTTEASSLLVDLLAEIKRDPKGEPGLQGSVYALLAKFALQRGDVEAAQSWISKALAGQLLERGNDKRDYADAWLTQAMLLQRTGKLGELKRSVADMQAWAAKLQNQDEWIAISLLRAKAIEAWSEGQHDQALEQLKLAMSKANTLGVPELMVDVGQAYAQALLGAGKVEDAVAVSGQLSTWSELDWRAAWTQACVYRALGQASSWEQYRNKARKLAGDRVLPADVPVPIY